MNSIASRLKEAREEAGLTQPALADKAGVSQGTIGNIESGLRKRPRDLLAIAAALGVTPLWLETGKEPKRPEYRRAQLFLAQPGDEDLEDVSAWGPDEPDATLMDLIEAAPDGLKNAMLRRIQADRRWQDLANRRTIAVPVLHTKASMGYGEDTLDEEAVSGTLRLGMDWVDLHLRGCKLDKLRFIHGHGDSMAPTFNSGDVLLVDASVNEVKVDGIYVLSAHDRLFIKRVRQRMDNGTFEISSDNPAHKTVDVLNGNETVTVHGRVVWAWNGKKV